MINKTVIAFASMLATFSYASEPFVIFDGNATTVPKQPQACGSEDGIVHMTFGVGEQVYYCKVEGDKASVPIRVNDVESSAREGLHAMTSTASGVLWCVWLDLREKGTRLVASQSIDQGISWSKNIPVYRSPNGSVCACCHPSIAADDTSIHVLFRNSLAGNRDMY